VKIAFEYNTKLDVPNEFYTHILESGKDWYEINDKYYLGQIFREQSKYIVHCWCETVWVKHFDFIVYVSYFLIDCSLLAYFLTLLARRVFYPLARITKELRAIISASNLHNRLPQVRTPTLNYHS
jgi:hypothetical protein